MSRFDVPEPVPVPIGPCECPGTPHEQDIVYLAPVLSMAGGMAAQVLMTQGEHNLMRIQELLADLWIRHGVVDWNLTDERGKVPLTPDNIALALPFGKGGRLVADKADDLYAQDVLAPLVETLGTLSQRGPTADGRPATSPRKRSTPKRPSPSSTPDTDKAPLTG